MFRSNRAGSRKFLGFVANACLSGRTGRANVHSSPWGRKPMTGRMRRVISLPPVAIITGTLAPICRRSQRPAPGCFGSAAQSIKCAAGTT